ncbi:hypothetical protein BH23ACT11_BH23ACT11_24050 [soil metagenome]
MSDPESVTHPGEDNSAKLKLALRLLDSEDPYSADRTPILHVGQLPDALTVDIPIPPEAEVVGSMERIEFEGDRMVEVVLDVSEPTEQFLVAYKEQAARLGWTEPRRPRRGGGFDFSPDEDKMFLCHGDRGPALFVNINRPYKGDEEPADVRLRLMIDDRHSPCAPDPYEDDFERHIPRLRPPPGARQSPGGGGGGPDEAQSNATLEADLEVSAVGEHYAGELAAAGWSGTGRGHSGPQAWSTWSFTDERDQSWRGVFTALQLPDSGKYLLQIHVHWSRKLNNA